MVLLLILAASAGQARADNSALNPLGVETIDALILIILDAIVKIGVPVITFFFVLTGFYYTTAMGDTSKVSKAHTMFRYTLIGSAVVLGAKVIYEILRNTLTKLN